MQTFLPYPDFNKSAQCLDYRRLGKQRVETKQIALILLGENPNSRWRNHPATKMWNGCEQALLKYGAAMCEEWIGRGYKDSLLPWFNERIVNDDALLPSWFGEEKFHASHRSNLLRKKYEYYSKFEWKENIHLPYFWPINER